MGTRLFDLDPADPHQYAWVKQASAWHYIEGYEEAARVLLEYAESDDGRRSTASDRVAYPMVYLCRQAMELRLKELIETGNRCLGTNEPSTDHGHNLHKLWNSARRVILRAWPGTQLSDLSAVERIIVQLHGVDGSGTAFRYARSESGTPSLPQSLGAFSLQVFFDEIEKVTTALDGATTGIDAEHEMRMDYERELREAYEADMREPYEEGY